MRTPLSLRLAIIVSTVALSAVSPVSAEVSASASPMAVARSGATTTTLPDGRILIVGGSNGTGPTASAEIFSPTTGAWTSASPMSRARAEHSAVSLPDGRILITGGTDGQQILRESEIFDPTFDTWTSTAALVYPRREHATTMLKDGRVLLTGGYSTARCPADADARTEMFDPATNSWTLGGWLFMSRAGHDAHLLADGTVLLVGGNGQEDAEYRAGYASAEIYDPETATGRLSQSALVGRTDGTTTQLPDGRILWVGGCCLQTPTSIPSLGTKSEELAAADAEIYDPTAHRWTRTALMGAPRMGHTATLLADGRVLVAGGIAISLGTHGVLAGNEELVAEIEIYDPLADTWMSAGTLATSRAAHMAARLPDGTVLIAGGWGGTPDRVRLASAELLTTTVGAPSTRRTTLPTAIAPAPPQPASGVPPLRSTGASQEQIDMSHARARADAVRLTDGRVLIAGGAEGTSYSALQSAELFDPATATWTVTAPMRSARYMHRLTLLADGRVLATGGFSAPGRQAEIFDPAAGTWTLTTPMRRHHAVHTATLLRDGRVLVSGGHGGYDGCQNTTAAAEIYDPTTDVWVSVASMRARRGSHTASLLKDGRVLVAGGATSACCEGATAAAEIYDPRADRWTYAESMRQPRWGHTANVLSDGSVLVVGGCCLGANTARSATGDVRPSAPEVYDPETNAWTTTGPMETDRYWHTATRLDGGTVVVAGGLTMPEFGGLTSRSIASVVELYDPITRRWRSADPYRARFSHAAVALDARRVLIAGGAILKPSTLNPPPVAHTDIFTEIR